METVYEMRARVFKALCDERRQRILELLHGGEKQEEAAKKGWVCGLCGYVYEGETLPEGFTCPVCHAGAEKFEPLK